MITVTSKGTDFSVTKKMLNDAARYAAEEVAAYWHRTYLPNHFTVAGGKEYGYQPRKGDNEPPRIPGRRGNLVSNQHYSWRKRRQMHHNKPLVWSGRSEQQAKQMVRLSSRVRDGQVQASATMNLPNYFYMYRKDQNAPDKVNELTRTVPTEVEDMTRVYQNAFSLRIAGSSASSTTTTERIA